MVLHEIAAVVRTAFLLGECHYLGRRHVGYGLKAQHYVLVGSALLWTLEKALGEAFTSEVKDAWASAYILLWTTMTDAANERPMAA